MPGIVHDISENGLNTNMLPGLGVPLYTFMPLPDGGVMAEISLANCGVIARGGGKNNQEVRLLKIN